MVQLLFLLFHGVNADHVAFGVVNEGNVAVVADGEFGLMVEG